MAHTTLSKLQENFTCLAIVCVDLIKLPLTDILDNHVKPSDLYTELNSSTLISGNKLRSDQKKLCYITPPGIPDYSKFDVTLLCTLIQNLCPSLKPSGRWGKEPAAAHTQLGDDVERLRRLRNRFAHANSAQTSESDFQNYWTDIQNVITRIQKNKNAGCKTDYRQKFRSIEERLLNWDDLEKYRLLLDATVNLEKERGEIDEPDIWIKDPEKVVCGSTARFEAVVQGKQGSSVTWQKLYKDKSKQIEKGNQKFWGRSNEELVIESVCKEDEGTYQAVLSIEEDRIRKTIQSNVIFLQVVGGIPDLTTSHETCLQTHSVKLVGNVFLIDDLPVIEEIYWSKDGNLIDTHGNEGKYSKVSVDVPSLTIYNVNQNDAGHYTLTATNAAGTTVSDAIVLGVPEIVLEECEEGCDSCQIFPVTIKSIPTAYNVQWQVANKQSDTLTPLDENAEEYRGTTNSIPHPVLVVRRKEQLKNNIYQIKVQNFIGGRIKKISSILNMFYQDRGACAVFAKLSNALAKEFPEEKLNQLHGLILDSLKDKLSIEKKETAREYFDILKENELFTPSDVIFMQFLLRESNCEELNEKCIAYATTQNALCFYEERPRNGYKKVQFHVQGSISNYTSRQIVIIKETVAAIIGCDNEEIHVNGLCKSTSFLVVLSMKERYANVLFNMKQHDKDKLISLNINYIILDSNYVYLEKVEEEKKRDNSLGQKIIAPDWLRPSNTTELQKSNPQTFTYPEEMDLPRNALIMAAIDFGTTFSGYAFARRVDFEKNQSIIHVPSWSTLIPDLISFKTPTTVLMDKDEEFVAFGFEAETKYAEQLKDEKGDDYFYFHRFKMLMYSHAKVQNLNSNTKISDIRGRKLPAMKVFTSAIEYLKNHLLNHLKEKFNDHFKTDDIYWVLTVPAIWNDKAKLFMRSAAQKAGITTDQLIVALEPEAAAIYCRLHDTNTINPIQPGSKYLVLDAGGGTVDITVHEVEKNGQLEELERASGGDWGGTSVDIAFKNALAEIVTKEMIERYSQENPKDYLHLIRSFEIGKRSCRDSFITLNIPFSFYNECLELFEADLIIMNSKFKSRDMIWRDGKLRIKIDFFETFFQPACNEIIKHVKELFQSPKMKDVNNILMVGGFSESYKLQEEIRKAFPNCQVFVPKEAGLAVLRGAVLFGLNPWVINSRFSRFTYGVDMNAIFDPAIHEESKKEVIEGVEYCTGIFDKHVEIGDQLVCGKAHDFRFYIPITKQQDFVSFHVCASSKRNPVYIDDCGCFIIGEINACVPVGSKDRVVYVRMRYDFTEITVEATVNKQTSYLSIDLLDEHDK